MFVAAAGISCLPFQGIMRLRAADLKARIEKGAIGDIVLMHQVSRWSIAEDWYNSGTPGWFADPSQVPGGAFIGEGIYRVDLLLPRASWPRSNGSRQRPWRMRGDP